jgi:PKD repeat protein
VRLENQNIVGDAVIDVTVPYGILLSGIVQNSYGVGVENVDLDAKNAGDDSDVPLVGDYTDVDGTFATVLVPGTYHLEIEPPRARRLAAEKLYDQSYNSDTEIFAAMDTGMVVSGTISFSDGTPIPDMAVTAAVSSTQEEAFSPGNDSDLAGFYEILLAPETYDITFSPDPLSGLPDTTTVPDIVIAHDMDFDFVYGTEMPIANFTGDPLSGAVPLEVTFTDLSINNPTSWDWDFGDGGTSFEQNPVYVYENTGLYTVSLTVTNEHGSDIKVETDYINVFEGGDCGSYVVGDFNGSGSFNVADVVDAYSKLKTGSPPPFIECECPPGSGIFWAVAMDVNNSCSFNVADVVSGYSRLKTGSPELAPCEFCPPSLPSPRYGDERLR